MWTSFFKKLERLGKSGACGSSGDQQKPERVEPEGMADFFEAVADEYNAHHTYDLLNRIVSSWQVPPDTNRDAMLQTLRQDCLIRGRVDNVALRQLITDARIKPRLDCIHCKRFGRGSSRHGLGGGLLCSGCERAWVQEGHTEPPTMPANVAEARDEGMVRQLLMVAQQAERAVARPWAWCGARSNVGRHSLRHFLLGSEELPPTTTLEQPVSIPSLGSNTSTSTPR